LGNKEPCPICETQENVQFFEIPEVKTQHFGYNVKANGSHWICDSCLISLFNNTFMKIRSPLLSADLIYGFVVKDMTMLATIFLKIDEHIKDREVIDNPKVKRRTGMSDIMNAMPQTKDLLGGEIIAKTNVTSIFKKTAISDNGDRELSNRMLMPKEIESLMSKTIIGQDRLVKDLSTAAYKYLLSLANTSVKRPVILVMGASGTGKTEGVKALTQILDRPILSLNSSMLTPSGYRGENVNMIADKLISMFGPEKARNAVLYLDEFDKLIDPDGTQETIEFKRSVLPELYKILDGDAIVSTNQKGETLVLETSGILVIMTGAFQKMEDSKNQQMKLRSVGFTENINKEEIKPFSFADVTRKDMTKYGFPAELIGRLSVRTFTTKFTKEDYLRILKTSNASVLKEYTLIFKSMRATVEYTDEFLLSVIEQASEERTGARTMKSIIEERLLSELYHADLMVGKRVIINKDSIEILDRETAPVPNSSVQIIRE
jgi:ATP-dependent Clp protease ATP-binding subunit ClpX